MKKDEKRLYYVFGFLFIVFIFIAGITIAYARMTSTLKIEGYGSVNNAKWSVHFENLRDTVLIGSTKEVTKPTIQSNSTAIAQYDVNFQRPNDGVTYIFDVVNDGDLDAKLSNYTVGHPICTGTVAETRVADERLVCDNLTYKITYQDGTQINVDDTLNVGDRKTMKVTLEFKGDTLPQNVVNISGLGISLIYTQKD